MDNAPEVAGDRFQMYVKPFYQGTGGRLQDLIGPGVQLWLEFSVSTTDEVSNRYRVTRISTDYEGPAGSTTIEEGRYYVQIEGQFGSDVNIITDDPSGFASTKIIDTSQIRFYKYEVENRPQFDGRFFVKIYADGIFRQYVNKIFTDENEFKITAKREVFSLSDEMHKPTFAGGAIQMFNSRVDTTADANGNSLPWSQPGLITFNTDAPGTQGDATYWFNELMTFQNFYGAIGIQNTMDPNRDEGYWRKVQFLIWFLDGCWWADNSLDQLLQYTAAQNLLQGGNASMGHSLTHEFSTPSGAFGNGHNYEGQDWYEKPDREVDKWFIDSGKFRMAVQSQWDDDLPPPMNSNYWGTSNASIPAGGYTSPGIIDAPNGNAADSDKIYLGFGPMFGEIDFNNVPQGTDSIADFFKLGNNSPEYSHESDFIDKLKPGAKFRWKEDPQQTVYTVQANVGYYNLQRWSSYNEGSISSPTVGTELKERRGGHSPANFTKRYHFEIEPKIQNQWNPFANPYEPIDNGLNFLIPTSSSATAVNGLSVTVANIDQLHFETDTIVGVDIGTGLECQIVSGMIITHFDNNGSGSYTNLKSATLEHQYLLVDEVVYNQNTGRYKIYLTGYEWPLRQTDTSVLSTLLASRNVRFRQASVNHVSPEFCNNFNRVIRGGFHQQTYSRNIMGAVGYQLEFIEPIEKEELLPDYPAIWETEPKEQAELDIYYEVGGSNPLELNSETVKTAIPIGSTLVKPLQLQQNNYWPVEGLKVINHSSSPSSIIANNTLLQLDGQIINPPSSLNAMTYYTLGPNENSVDVIRPDGTKIGPIKVSSFHIGAAGVQYVEFQYQQMYSGVNYGLSYFNCYSFANGVESNRIRDNFNLPFMSNGVKASTTQNQPYKEERRKSGLIYSGIYNSINGINNLNQFIAAEKITKDVNPDYGSIQKLHSRDSDLVTLCEDKVLKILANKDAVYNADGDPQLIATSNVLGQTIPFSGEYGISQNPESFASESYRSYFTDKQRGVVLRLSKDGLTPISDYGMKDWFRDHLNLKTNDKIDGRLIDASQSQFLGSYDTRNDEYNINISYKDISSGAVPSGKASKLVSFKEDVKGWISFKSFTDMEVGISVANEYITMKKGVPYKHYSENTERNTFYGDYADSTFKVLLNDEPSSVKTYNTLNYEGSQSKVSEFIDYTDSDGNMHTDKDYHNLEDVDGWYVSYIETDLQDGSVAEFINKENKWFNYINGTEINTNEDGLVTSVIDESEFSFQGLGTVSSSSVVTTVYGCTDSAYLEYNPNATVDDGSCLTLGIQGCTNPIAINYDATANIDDGNCQIEGCTDPSAFNFNQPPGANIDDGSCIPVVEGCDQASVITGLGASPDTNGLCENGVDVVTGNAPLNIVTGYPYANACFVYGNHPGYNVANFTPNVNTPTACDPLPSGCIDTQASNYNINALLDDGSCEYLGCTDPSALNYNQFAQVDDGSCCYQQGCTDPTALNYDPNNCLACFDDNGDINGFGGNCCEQCTWGCMIPGNPNYDPAATCYDANMCTSPGLSYGCTDPNFSNYNPTVDIDDGNCVLQACLDPNNDGYYGDDCTTLVGVNGTTASTFDNNGAIYTIPNFATVHQGGVPVVPTVTTTGNIVHVSSLCTYYGCMLQTDANGNAASNYDPSANTPCDVSGSGPGNNECCQFIILGCTNPTAFNYNPLANTLDPNDPCYPVIPGCTDPTASNFITLTGNVQVDVNTDDGSCIVPILGCTDSTAGRWNDINGQSIYSQPCSDPTTTTNANGVVVYSGGCIDTLSGNLNGYLATNYNPAATQDDGSCAYVVGCTDGGMFNALPNGTGISSNDPNDCIPVIKGCLKAEHEDNGVAQLNYNVGSGIMTLSSDPAWNYQPWSQDPVVTTGNPHFDVNTHEVQACIPCNDGDCEKPAGCVVEWTGAGNTVSYPSASPQNQAVNYQYGNMANTANPQNNPTITIFPPNIQSTWQMGIGPYTMSNSVVSEWIVTNLQGAVEQINPTSADTLNNATPIQPVPYSTHPFNYDEQWKDTYDPDPNIDEMVPGLGEFNSMSIGAYGGTFPWDVSNMNACCNVSGCAHPYALNFDLKGWKRNPSDLDNPIYVGRGLPNYDSSQDTGRVCRTCPETQGGGAPNEGENISRYFYAENTEYGPIDISYAGTFLNQTDKWFKTQLAWRCCHFEGDYGSPNDNGPVGCTDPNACNVNMPNNNGWTNYHPGNIFDDGSCCKITPPNNPGNGSGTGDCTGCAGLLPADDFLLPTFKP
jgi:hypothetical protein